ncbi:MAG: anaerobic ribonucleoside-triphosphate reductase activating protein [Cellulosilyticaceae bacterium]
MYVAQMRPYDIANGTGIRATLFVSGCTHQCEGCFNKDYKDFAYGTKWDKAQEEVFMGYINNPNVHGVTILGGEPMDQIQDDDLVNLLKRIKEETSKTIWVYSGYTFEQIIKNEKKVAILQQCDVLVDGPFVEKLKDVRLAFRGSSNQRILDAKASLEDKEAVWLPSLEKEKL